MTLTEFIEQYSKLKTDEERTLFINNRINELLSKTDNVEKIGAGLCGSYDKFISPKTLVFPNAREEYNGGLILDDMDIYKKFMDYIDNDVNKIDGQPKVILYLQVFILESFSSKYCGLSNCQRSDAREDIYDSRNASIKEFYNSDLALCLEKSAFVHNLLMFLGIESKLMIGKLNDGGHVYITLKIDGSENRILYDPHNFVQIYNSSTVRPAVCLMSKEAYQNLEMGGTFDFDYSLVKKIYSKEDNIIELERKYTSDDVLYIKDELSEAREEYIKRYEAEVIDEEEQKRRIDETRENYIRMMSGLDIEDSSEEDKNSSSSRGIKRFYITR